MVRLPRCACSSVYSFARQVARHQSQRLRAKRRCRGDIFRLGVCGCKLRPPNPRCAFAVVRPFHARRCTQRNVTPAKRAHSKTTWRLWRRDYWGNNEKFAGDRSACLSAGRRRRPVRRRRASTAPAAFADRFQVPSPAARQRLPDIGARGLRVRLHGGESARPTKRSIAVPARSTWSPRSCRTAITFRPRPCCACSRRRVSSPWNSIPRRRSRWSAACAKPRPRARCAASGHTWQARLAASRQITACVSFSRVTDCPVGRPGCHGLMLLATCPRGCARILLKFRDSRCRQRLAWLLRPHRQLPRLSIGRGA